MSLTPREMLVMRLRAKGLPNKAVAAELGLVERTVKDHVVRIYKKLGVPGMVEAMNVLGWVRVPTDDEYRAWLVEREDEAHRRRLELIEEHDAIAVIRFLQPINPDPVTPLAKARKW